MAQLESALLSPEAVKTAIAECENAEVNDLGAPAPPERYVKHLLLHLINDDMEHARHLWRRIDPSLQQGVPELGNVWALAERLREGKDVPGAFERMQAADVWSAEAQPLVNQLTVAVRRTQVALISKGFTVVSEEYALRALGLSDAAVLQSEFGWTVRPDGMYDVAAAAVAAPALPAMDGKLCY